jgi:hypothetical protein
MFAHPKLVWQSGLKVALVRNPIPLRIGKIVCRKTAINEAMIVRLDLQYASPVTLTRRVRNRLVKPKASG